MRVLLTGIPGTGKTTLGTYLADHADFYHQDMEADNFAAVQKLHADPTSFLSSLSKYHNIVISWGFNPKSEVEYIKLIRDSGYKLIWLEGNHDSSFDAFLRGTKRSVQDILNYKWQMNAIASTGIVNTLKPTVIDPYLFDGQFRPIQELAAEIKTLCLA
jgi:shikimate kinase